MSAPAKPRKKPMQARSQQTVDSIIEAGARILAEEGYAKMTTNHVAERAGVSIGSLYQYFSGKASLLSAVHDRHQRRIAQKVGADFDHAEDLGTYSGTRALIWAVLRAHRIEPRIHGVLDRLRREGVFAADLQNSLHGWLADKLEGAIRKSHGDRLPNLHLAAQIMVTTVHEIIEAHEHGDITCTEEELVEEISQMVFAYKAVDRNGPL